METRTITEVKVWILVLNPMTSNTEAGNIVAISYDRQKLIDWYNSQLAPEGWTDYGENSFPSKGDMPGYSNSQRRWHKTFVKGSDLEWYNPCASFEGIDHYGHGMKFEWCQENDINGRFKRIS